MISVYCTKHRKELNDAWQKYKEENGITSDDVGYRTVWIATEVVLEDSKQCEDACGVIGLSKRGKIERLENPKKDWFLGDILPD